MVAQPMDLADWRRQVNAPYVSIRATDDPVAAHWQWREARDRLFKRHAQSPLAAAARRSFTGLPYYDYDPALRFAVDLVPNGATAVERWDIGADGTIALRPFAHTDGLASTLGGHAVLDHRLWRRAVPAIRRRNRAGRDLWRRPLCPGRHQGRRPRHPGRPPNRRLQLRLQPVLRPHTGLDLSPGPARKPPADPDPRRRNGAARIRSLV